MALTKIGATLALDGEKEYREGIKNINSAMKELQSEMKLSSATFSDNANSIEALENKHTILSKQIDKQTSKVTLYSKAMEDSAEKQENAGKKIDLLSTELEKAQREMSDMAKSSDTSSEAIEKQQSAIDNLKTKLSSAQGEYDKATVSTSKYQTSLNYAEADLLKLNGELAKNDTYLDEAKKSADKCATSIDNMGKDISDTSDNTLKFGDVLKANITGDVIIGGVKALANAFQDVAKGVVDLAASAATYADDMLTTSTITGISTDNLQAYNYMAELTDTSMDTLSGTMVKTIKSMSNAQKGSADYVDAFSKLKVAYEDGNGTLLDSETVYWNIIDALGGMTNETERDATAMTLLGKSAQDVNTLVAIGSTGVKKFTDEAKNMGAVLDKDTLASLGETDDALQRFTQTVEITKRKVGAEMAPALTQAAEDISNKINEVGDDLADFAGGAVETTADALMFIAENAELVTSVIGGMTGGLVATKVVVPVVNTVVAAWVSYKAATDGATISQWALNAAQSANPIGLLVTSIAALTTGLVMYSSMNANVTTEEQKLIETHQAAIDVLKEDATTREENRNKMIAEAGTIANLKSELVNLNDKEKISNEEKSRMAIIVEKLNDAMPELNLSINEQTGYLMQSTEETEKLIDASLEYMKIMSAQEELQNIAKAQYDAEVELTQILNDKNEAQEKANTLQAQYNLEIADGTPPLYDTMVALATAQDTVASLTAEENALKDTIASTGAEFDTTTAYIKEHTEATAESSDAQVAYKDTMYAVSGEVAASIQTIQTAYDDAKTSAEESLQSQVGMFDELKAKSDLSTAQMAENLSSQTEVFNQYKDDLISAAELVEKGLMDEGLLGSIEKLGVDGAGYLHELVTAAENDKESFAKVMDEWAAMETSRDMLSGTMADIETDYSGQMDSILGIVTDKVGEIDETVSGISESMKTITTETAESVKLATENSLSEINTTILTERATINKSIKLLSSGMLTSIDTELNIVDGKSLKFQSKGLAITDGIAQGITDGTGKVSAAIKTMVQKAVDSIDLSGIVAQIDEKLGDRIS